MNKPMVVLSQMECKQLLWLVNLVDSLIALIMVIRQGKCEKMNIWIIAILLIIRIKLNEASQPKT